MIVLAFLQLASAQNFALPPAWLRYCTLEPAAQCEVAVITAEDLGRINLVINHALQPAPDEQGKDRWTVWPEDAADCDDYAVTKMQTLRALGFHGEMRLSMGQVQQNGKWIYHTVLEADLDGKTWVLDNLASDFIYGPKDRPYKWLPLATQSHKQMSWTSQSIVNGVSERH